jgi:hypothetical protein
LLQNNAGAAMSFCKGNAVFVSTVALPLRQKRCLCIRSLIKRSFSHVLLTTKAMKVGINYNFQKNPQKCSHPYFAAIISLDEFRRREIMP